MRSYYPKSFNICVNCVVVNNLRGIFSLKCKVNPQPNLLRLRSWFENHLFQTARLGKWRQI